MARVIVNAGHLSEALGVESAAEVLAVSGQRISAEDEFVIGAALEGLYDAQAEAAAQADGDSAKSVLLAPNRQSSALLQTYLAQRATEQQSVQPAEVPSAEAPLVGVEAKFDEHDLLGWLGAFVPFVRNKLGIGRRDPRPPLSPEITPMPDTAKVAVIGDWGTNMYGAPPISYAVQAEGGYDLLVHLGDVYYAGSREEVQTSLLAGWKRMQQGSPDTLSRTCNSNHEMYSGGAPLYELTLPAFEQSSTTWATGNEYWLFVGLDAAYVDHDLDDEQLPWLQDVMAQQGDRKVVLFSHHQLFSALSGQGPKLTAKLQQYLAGQRIFAWYWGHEHLLALYEPHPSWGLTARCVGHGGFPYFRPHFGGAAHTDLPNGMAFRTFAASVRAPQARVLDGSNEYLGDHRDRYGPNGFMRLRLEGPELQEEVVTPAGATLWTGQLA